jgi:hypothetical protein
VTSIDVREVDDADSVVSMTRYLLLAAVTATALLGPAARAADVEPIDDVTFCRTVETLVAAANDGFRALEGAVKHGPLHVWAATVAVPGGTDCRVFGGPLPIYGCTLYIGDDDEKADAIYQDVGGRVFACLGTGWTSEEYEYGDAAQTVLDRPGSKAVVRISSRLSNAVANEIRFWIDGR